LAAITWLPADDFGQQELLSIRVGGEGKIIDFYPGVAKDVPQEEFAPPDRKSTRLNSSHRL